MAFASLDHAVCVGESCSDRLFAQNGAHAGVGRLDAQLGMGVIRGGDADDIRRLLPQHVAEVGVDAHLGPDIPPVGLKCIERLRPQIADTNQLRLRVLMVG